MRLPTREEFNRLANLFGLPVEEVALIALNRYGLQTQMTDERIRFVLRLQSGEEFYFAVCVNTGPTPFSLRPSGEIWLGDSIFGHVVRLERDTCDSTYFRRHGTELTVNSNSRSLCVGCAFCGTYSLAAEDQEALTTSAKLKQYFRSLMLREGLRDFSHVIRTTICTGCFQDEMAIVDHILMVYDVIANLGFHGRMRYIGAQLGISGLRTLARRLSTFSISYTVECFTERDRLLHPLKSITSSESICLILREAQGLGFGANFLYVLGLEELEVVKAGFLEFSRNVNRFPVIQILQRYTHNRLDCATATAQNFEYFLSARKMLEAIFAGCLLRPRIWENYRGLWYHTYRGRKLDCVRM